MRLLNMKTKQKGLPTAAMVGIVVAVVAVAGIAVVTLNPQTTSTTTTSTSTTTSTTSWTFPQGERIGFFEVVLDLEVPENSNENGQNFRVGTAQITPSDDLINEIFDQYLCFPENSFQSDGKVTYTFWVRASGEDWLIDHDIPPIHQDDIGRKFCFYTEWRVFYISEPVVFSMTVILPPGYAVDNVQCLNNQGAIPYVITSQDNRAKIVAENARIEDDFERFILRIDYENTLL